MKGERKTGLSVCFEDPTFSTGVHQLSAYVDVIFLILM